MGIECTRNRPRRRRGPPSKYVASLLEQNSLRHTNVTTERPQSALDSLAPFSTIEVILQDWFEYVHPLASIFHRDIFWQRYKNLQQDDGTFACLVASVCAATVTTLRRRASNQPTVRVDACYDFVKQFWQTHPSERPTLISCQIKYNLSNALMAEYNMDHFEAQSLGSQACSMISYLIHYEIDQATLCDQELMKRLYCLCFAGQW